MAEPLFWEEKLQLREICHCFVMGRHVGTCHDIFQTCPPHGSMPERITPQACGIGAILELSRGLAWRPAQQQHRPASQRVLPACRHQLRCAGGRPATAHVSDATQVISSSNAMEAIFPEALQSLAEADPEVFHIIQDEKERQWYEHIYDCQGCSCGSGSSRTPVSHLPVLLWQARYRTDCFRELHLRPSDGGPRLLYDQQIQ